MIIGLFIVAMLLIFIDWKYHLVNSKDIVDDFLKHNYDYKSAVEKLKRMDF